ncbi:ABC transporter ATP-binding protein [Maridesulfovibrio ferrireducens]|uniref:ABC transporter ATP-binding protein n=1 Tax=Maridesulfovibrio ferrireducens TaxID=246191 RepID=UPI001A20FAD7|nr:ABC transporter ATP-binding protein [Maridesulfovibrio ferrireducens]MBI9111282.1 ABC transporter ATP-binding protein [Maridesulfovibrio ferrireducens]
MNLKVNGLNFNYNGTSILEEINFSVDKGELLAILGPNGAGKTTLLKCLNAIHKPEQGCVLIKEQDVFKLSSDDIAKLLGYVPQRVEPARLSVFDAVLMGRKPHIKWRVRDHDICIVDAALKRLSLCHLSLRYIDQLSGGELQKVSIARALVQEPEVLLLDEPTSSLDLKNQLEILRTVRGVVKGHMVSAIMTMHDLNTALRYADKFIFLKDGTIYGCGATECVTPEMIEAVYGVPVEIEIRNGCPVIHPIEDLNAIDHSHTHSHNHVHANAAIHNQ